jgi:hypothetical protein
MKEFLKHFEEKVFPDIKDLINIRRENPEFFTESELSKNAFLSTLKTNFMKAAKEHRLEDSASKLFEGYEKRFREANPNMEMLASNNDVVNPFSAPLVKKDDYGSGVGTLLQDNVSSISRQPKTDYVKENNTKVMTKYGITPNSSKPAEKPETPKTSNADNLISAVDRFRMKKSVSKDDVYTLMKSVTKFVEDYTPTEKYEGEIPEYDMSIFKSLPNRFSKKMQNLISAVALNVGISGVLTKSSFYGDHNTTTIKKNKMTEHKRMILQLLARNNKMTIPELAKHIQIAERNIELNIKDLEMDGVLEHEGPDNAGRWVVKDAPPVDD